jgi:hypothetical protein
MNKEKEDRMEEEYDAREERKLKTTRIAGKEKEKEEDIKEGEEGIPDGLCLRNAEMPNGSEMPSLLG